MVTVGFGCSRLIHGGGGGGSGGWEGTVGYTGIVGGK
jgi:hypothetical protein